MSVPDFVARQTMRMAEALAHFIQTTNEDKLTWRLTGEGATPTRSALEQVSECVQVNRLLAAVLRGETVDMRGTGRPEIHFADGVDAQAQLLASAKELADAIQMMPEEALGEIYQHPRGPMRGENIIMMGYRNMAYHAGQINFIQILYSDMEFHLPPNWR